MRKIITGIYMVLISTAFVSMVSAEEISGVFFDQQIKDDQVQMKLQGTGIKSVAFFKAFAAGFYTTDETSERMLGQFPKRIEVAYFVSIPAYKMNNFTVKSMKENVSREEFEQIGDELNLMSRYFVDLKPGDRYSLTFIPGVGTKFVHNNRLVGVIEGGIFAKALFSTWLGNKPFDKKLKKKILGDNKISVDTSNKLARNIQE